MKYLLYTNYTSSVGYWREVVFILTFFGLVACLVIFIYWACQWHMCIQNAWFNLWRVFLIDDITFAHRWFPHAGAQLSFTCQQSPYEPEVTALDVTAKKNLTSARSKAYLLRISSIPTNHMMPHIINSSVL